MVVQVLDNSNNALVKDFRGHDAGNCVFFSFWRCAKRLYCEAVSSRTTE